MTAQNETSAKNNDKDDVRSTEFRPHDPIDVTDQNTIFLVLEELGIAHMQHAWLSAHSPEHEDAEQVANQAKEFFLDSCAILGGHVGPDRVKPNDWAGAALANFLNVLHKAGFGGKTVSGRAFRAPDGLYDPEKETLAAFIICGTPDEEARCAFAQLRETSKTFFSRW